MHLFKTEKPHDKFSLPWEYVDHYITDLHNQLKVDEIETDCVIGIGRGGLIPATMLAYKFGCNELVNFSVSLRDGAGCIKQTPQLDMFKNVIVVDDINDSGETFRKVSVFLSTFYPQINVTYCSLLRRDDTTFDIKTYHCGNAGTSWIHFPWEVD
jgi:hypoxanthine phosphoribosyltransferase